MRKTNNIQSTFIKIVLIIASALLVLIYNTSKAATIRVMIIHPAMDTYLHQDSIKDIEIKSGKLVLEKDKINYDKRYVQGI